jgi:DNA-binding Lrp family transcriptional regulator
MKAYVLIEVESGKINNVFEKVETLESVHHVDALLGPYDIIAEIEAEPYNIGRIVLDKIQPIDGVKKTTTCNVIQIRED